MKALEDCYELICALSEREVEYFRLFAVSQPGEGRADQAILFEALLDESRKPSGHVRRMMVEPDVAEGLNQELRRSLRYLQEPRSVASQIRGKIADAQLLRSKGLHQQCTSVLREARRTAAHFERFYDLLEVLNLQKAGLQYLSLLEEAAELRREIEVEERDTLDRLGNYIAYRNLAKEVSEAYRMPESAQGGPLNLLEQLFQSPLLRDAEQARSLTARYYFLHLHSTYHYYTGDLFQARAYSEQLMELLQRKPFLIDLSADSFTVTFFNHLALLLELGEYALFAERLQDFRRIPETLQRSDNLLLRQKVASRSDFLALKYYLYRGQYDKGFLRSRDMAAHFEKGQALRDLYFDAQLFYLIAFFHYLNDQFAEAVRWLNRILDSPEHRDDVRLNALVLRHVIAFEQGDLRAFLRELPSTIFFLEHSKRGLHGELALLHALQMALQEPDPGQVRTRFARLREELQTQRANPFERNPLGGFDAVSWLESRVNGTRFRDVLARRGSPEQFRAMR